MNVSNPSLKRTVTFLGLVATLFAGSASVAKTPVIFDTDHGH